MWADNVETKLWPGLSTDLLVSNFIINYERNSPKLEGDQTTGLTKISPLLSDCGPARPAARPTCVGS